MSYMPDTNIHNISYTTTFFSEALTAEYFGIIELEILHGFTQVQII